MSRKLYLVGYDIRDDKRLRKVHDVMLGFGDPVQYSVFVCELSEIEKILMIDKLTFHIKTTEDSVFIVEVGPANQRTKRRFNYLGQRPTLPEERSIVV
jgi:CRISPR-associated protein Cas2